MATSASDIAAATGNENVRKYLDMLAQSEGVKYSYATGFGNRPLTSLEDHPRTQSKFTQTDGKESSTSAAGRYQFLGKTWDGLKAKYGEYMPDFGADSQDFAATALLAQNGALSDVLKGDFKSAINKSGVTWASLPSSPYKQNKRSWEDISGYLGQEVSGGGGGAPVADEPAKQNMSANLGAFKAYQSGAMSDPQQRKDFENDVHSGAFKLPANAVAKVGKPAQEVPISAVVAFNQGKMTDQQSADFIRDVDAGKILIPKGANLDRSNAPTQEAQPTTLLGDIGQGATNFGKAAWNDGNIVTGIPKAAYGIAEAGVGGLAGMAKESAKGLYGLASGAAGVLPEAIGGGGGFEQGYNQGAQTIENLIPAVHPVTNAGQAVQQVIAAPAAELHRGGGAIGQGVENLTGSATLGGLAAAGTETLGNALMLGLPLKGRIAPEVVAGEQARASSARQVAANQPIGSAAPQAAEVAPIIEPVAPRTAQQPLAASPEGLAAQAETMQRSIETAPQATTAQAIAPSEGMNANAGQASVVPVNELANVADQAQAIEAPKTVTAVAPELLDITRSRPIEGGVDSALQQSRHDVLRNIGLTDGEIRAGAVAGDSRLLGQEKELAKADTEAGQAMQKQLDLENQKLTDYGDSIVRDTGGTFGAEAVHRGSSIVGALDSYASHYKQSVKADYAAAGERSGAAGIDLNGFMATLKDPANFKGGDGLSVRRDVLNTLRQRELLNKDGTVKPINAKQAEEIRQSINESWDQMKPQSQRAVGTLVNALDESVFSKLGTDEFAAARGRYKQYKEIFENPKGIAKILEANGANGINRSISLEKIGEKMRQLAETDSAQFEHIKQTLSNMPTAELQAAADKALGEIRAQIAEKITSAKTPAAIEKAYAPYKGSKLRQIFGEDLANKIENYVAGVGVLRTVDKNASGTASMVRNLVDKATRGGAVATGSAIGGVVSGGLGIAIGGLLGEAFAGRIKSYILEAIDAKALNKSLSKEQFATMQKVYESKLKALGATNEMKQAKKALNDDKPDSAKQIKSLSQRIERTKQWLDFAKLLSNEQKATIKKVGVIAWLSQTGQNEETK